MVSGSDVGAATDGGGRGLMVIGSGGGLQWP